jgi:hypothetical protein
MSTPPGLTCVACGRRLYPSIARATDNGWTHATRCPLGCGVEGCDRPRHAHGYCQMHMHRWIRYGDPLREPPRNVNREERLEDLWWMAETGECLSGAASRLGVQVKALEAWLRRHDRDLLQRLVAHEPRDHNRVLDGMSIGELTGLTARRRIRRQRKVAA